MRSINFRDGVLLPIGARVTIATASLDFDKAMVRGWLPYINDRLKTFLNAWPWPEWTLTEERAFRPVWNANLAVGAGLGDESEVYFPTTKLYYRALQDAPAGVLPTNTLYFEPRSGLAERYISYTQRCRRAIGEVLGVYSGNPRTMLEYGAYGLSFQPGEKGIDVLGGGNTVWVHFKLPVPVFSAEMHDGTKQYRRGDLIYWTDGDCYRAVNDSLGKNPPGQVYWVKVPFPEFAGQYVVAGAAGDAAEDVAAAMPLWQQAKDAFASEADKRMAQGQTTRYRNFGLRNADFGMGRGLPYGVAAWLTSLADSSGTSTLSDECVDEWGNPATTGGLSALVVPEDVLKDVDGLRPGDPGVTPGRSLAEVATVLREMYSVVTIVYGTPRSESDWQLVPGPADPAVPEDEVQPLDNDAQQAGIPLHHWLKVGGR